MVGRGLGMARFPQVERLAEAGWVRVGKQVHLVGGRHCSSMENLHWEGPPGTVQQLGQLQAVLMCWAMLSSVFVLEYYLDTLWKGTLLFIVCLVLVCSDVLSTVREQETWCFSLYGMAIGLWLMVSSIPPRRLVLNHTRGMYHFSISGRTVCQGPMHLVYVRLALSSDVYGRCFFQLVLCGHKLEPLVLVQLSERYEQMEFLGRHIARKLNINYFDYLASSYRHVVRHWPLGATFSPGIVQRKTQVYTKTSVADLDV